MKKSHPFLCSLFLLSVLVLAPSTNATDGATISVNPKITNVHVGDGFQVSVCTSGFDSANPVIELRFTITWDNALMEFAGHQIDVPYGWTPDPHGGADYYVEGEPYTSYYTLHATAPNVGAAVWEDRCWLTISFTCLNVGSSPLNLPSPVIDEDTHVTYGAFFMAVNGFYEPEVMKGAVNQIARAPPETPNLHVGGQLFTANKAVIVAPYLIGILSIIAVVSLVVRKKFT